jgi:two-component system NarL family sensor kinase
MTATTSFIRAKVFVPAVLIVFAAGMMLTLHERRLADGKLKQLTQRVIDAQEEERSRLARELHDGISQNLVGVRYAMDLASRKIQDGAEDAAVAIGRSIEALNAAIKEVRRLSHDLRPRVLDDLGLKPALDALCHNFAERTGIPVHFEARTFTDDLKPGASTALYRVAQEAFNNAERHSGASEITITLWSKNGRARMTVADNGKGFEDKRPERGGLGLRNMQERMAHFKGLLLVKTSPQGTTLTAMLPKSAALQVDKEARAA